LLIGSEIAIPQAMSLFSNPVQLSVTPLTSTKIIAPFGTKRSVY
jgi:hypothetical protein